MFSRAWLVLLLDFTTVFSKQNLRYKLIEYDIRLIDVQDEVVYGHKRKRSLGTVENGDVVGLWRGHYNDGAFEIPIVFDEDDEFEGPNQMSPGEATSILLKLRQMEDKLDNVIRFVTDFNKFDFLNGYIRIGSFTSGCWSYIGRLPIIYQPQTLNIGTGCDFTDTVEHEMMHALGFFHEQARPDRDNYVTVHWDNIPVERYINFDKANNIDSRGSPYDKRSVMHYSNNAFALDPSLPTMTSKDASSPVLGSAFTMSDTDMVQLRMLYRCESSVQNYATNCVASCPCRLDEGMCIDDSGCTGSLTCTNGVCTTPSNNSTSPTPTTPTPTSLAPTSPTPTSPTPTVAPTSRPTSVDSVDETNLALVIGLSVLGIAIVAGVLFT